MERRLPVAAVPDGAAELVDERGSPVWPLGPGDRAMLEEVGEAFGFRPVDTALAQTSSCATSTPNGLVVALGAAAASHTRLFAHLTGRSWVLVEDVEELPPPDRFDVLVTLESCLSSGLLDALYAPHLSRAPGILHAASAEQLRRLVLARAAAAVMGGDAGCRRVDVVPIVDLEPQQSADAIALGSAATRVELEASLTAGATILTVFTHSDGLDGDFGSEAILCPVDETWHAETAARVPTCRVTRYCYRTERSLDSLVNAGATVHPDAIESRVMVFNTCVGVTPVDSNVDAAFGLGIRLMQSPRLGALVTTWRPTIGSYRATDLLVRLLFEGVELGEAVARHNTLHAELGTGLRLCLLGDPALRAVPPGGSAAPPSPLPRTRSTAAPSRPSARPVGETALISASLSAADSPRVGSTPSLNHFADRVAEARAATDAYACSPDAPDAGDAMRAAVVDVIAQRGRFCDLWLRFASDCRMLALNPRCGSCSNSTVVYEVTLAVPGVSPRVLEICPRCGFTRDHPRGATVALHVSPHGVVRLLDAHLASEWAGAVTVQYRAPFPTRTQRWPVDRDGAPVREFALSEPLRPVPVVVSATFMTGSQLLMAGQALVGAGASSLALVSTEKGAG
ncbi:hypothetical protein ACFWBF_00775 [Streptomyces sp. NPDC060028]|uniref:hypothetical protein n=1 Tax=Streptomyces sp. NPDC060028 TaxID=3347041 RepID=UPI0036D1EEFB